MADFKPIQIHTLIGCDTCGSDLVHSHEFHCDPCLITYFERLLRNCHEATYLDAEFKAKILEEYQARLEQLKLRSPSEEPSPNN